MVRKVLEKSRYIILFAILSSVLSSVAAFVWGAYKALAVTLNLVATLGKDPHAAVAFIEVMDTFLIATALLIFAVGLYELFFGDIDLPEWLAIHDLHDLKAKLGSVVVLVMAVTFLKHLVEWKDPQGTLFFGVGVAVVSAVLIAFSYFGKKSTD